MAGGKLARLIQRGNLPDHARMIFALAADAAHHGISTPG